jgi:hypothetical protein
VALLCSEALRQRSRHIKLADTRTDFMRAIGMKNNTGGIRGTGTLLKDAMQRLFSARIIATTAKESKQWRNSNFSRAEDSDIETIPWWGTRAGAANQGTLWASEILLSQRFYDDIVRSAVPVDLHVLTTLHKSPMAMDIYSFLTWVNAFIERPMELSWEGMAMQFGTSSQTLSSFKQRWLDAFKKVSIFYEPIIKVERSKLIIVPSATHIPKKLPRRDD